MALTSRKPRPLDRGVRHVRDTRLIIIAAEGRLTEKQYFSMFRSTRVQLRVLPTGDGGQSAPEHVLARLLDFRDEFQLAADDELWLMIDVDRWGDGKLARVTREAHAGGCGLAVSRPCFETWLLFHYQAQVPNLERCSDIEQALRDRAGGSYNKKRLDLDALLPQVRSAAERARAVDVSPDAPWPQVAGSHVYRLIASLPAECFEDD